MNQEKPPNKRTGMYVSVDVHEDAHGLYYTEYTQWDTATAIKVFPVDEKIDPETGEKIWKPETHGEPLLSVMTRQDARHRMGELFGFVMSQMIS